MLAGSDVLTWGHVLSQLLPLCGNSWPGHMGSCPTTLGPPQPELSGKAVPIEVPECQAVGAAGVEAGFLGHMEFRVGLWVRAEAGVWVLLGHGLGFRVREGPAWERKLWRAAVGLGQGFDIGIWGTVWSESWGWTWFGVGW